MSSLVKSRKARNKLINQMRHETKFGEHFECDNIAKKFDELISLQPTDIADPQYLHRDIFRHFFRDAFSITDDLLLDRIFRAFDTDNDNKIKPEEFFHGMSTILRGSLSDQCEFAFRVYDINNDGFLTRDEMHQFLKHSFTRTYLSDEEYEESVRDLEEFFVKQLKKKVESGDGNRFTLEEFKDAVSNDELILQALGQFLPSDKYNMFFEETVVHADHQDIYNSKTAKSRRGQKC